MSKKLRLTMDYSIATEDNERTIIATVGAFTKITFKPEELKNMTDNDMVELAQHRLARILDVDVERIIPSKVKI